MPQEANRAKIMLSPGLSSHFSVSTLEAALDIMQMKVEQKVQIRVACFLSQNLNLSALCKTELPHLPILKQAQATDADTSRYNSPTKGKQVEHLVSDKTKKSPMLKVVLKRVGKDETRTKAVTFMMQNVTLNSKHVHVLCYRR